MALSRVGLLDRDYGDHEQRRDEDGNFERALERLARSSMAHLFDS